MGPPGKSSGNQSSAISGPICAMVVGAGGFGRHYARILSRLNEESLAGVPKIRRLVLTRTDAATAVRQAKELAKEPLCAVEEMIGARVGCLSDLERLLCEYKPAFVGVVARDRTAGDTVHVRYTKAALAWGSVLCEKPFCAPDHHREALSVLADFQRLPPAGTFGLELPMAVVRRQLTAHSTLGPLIEAGRRFEFQWETEALTGGDIFSNLVHHPWSLLSDSLVPVRVSASAGAHRADIRMELENPGTGRRADCRIDLAIGGRCRRMAVDGGKYEFLDKGGTISVVARDRAEGENGSGSSLLTVENPLKQNIVAVLRGKPVTGLASTIASQRFLQSVYRAIGR